MVLLRKWLRAWRAKMYCWGTSSCLPLTRYSYLFFIIYLFITFIIYLLDPLSGWLICLYDHLENVFTSKSAWKCHDLFYTVKKNMWIGPLIHICLFFFNPREQVSHLWYLKPLSFIAPWFFFPVLQIFLFFYNVFFQVSFFLYFTRSLFLQASYWSLDVLKGKSSEI